MGRYFFKEGLMQCVICRHGTTQTGLRRLTAPMRLSPEPIAQIRQSATESFGPEAGSPRGHDTAKHLT